MFRDPSISGQEGQLPNVQFKGTLIRIRGRKFFLNNQNVCHGFPAHVKVSLDGAYQAERVDEASLFLSDNSM